MRSLAGITSREGWAAASQFGSMRAEA